MSGNGELSERTPEQAAYEAREVKQFLAHPLVQAAFAATEKEIHSEWARAGNPLEREMCWHELHAFRRWRTKIRAAGDGRPLALVTEEDR